MHVTRKLAQLAACVGLLTAAPAAMAQTTLKMVSHSDLKVLDPVWTSALITRNHGYMIYDVLFAKDADLKVQPQMAEKYEVSPDKLTWTITLRDGLEWHDGTPVTAEDCVASLKRWMVRDSFGQLLAAATGELKVIDAKTDSFVFEVTGNSDKVQTFVGLMETLGLVEIGRTGIVAMSRGAEQL